MTASSQSLPNVFLLGAAKAGTTSLYAYLKQHPQICFSSVKEPHFFDDEGAYGRGVAWYTRQYFTACEDYPARCDATPMLHLPEVVIPHISETYQQAVKELRFIVVLRNPVERAWSHYLHRIRFAVESETFAHALEMEDTRLVAAPSDWAGYFRDGLYAAQLAAWFQAFGRDQFAVILHETLRQTAEKTLLELCQFLSVDSAVSFDTGQHSNVAAQPRSRILMRMVSRPPTMVQNVAQAVLPQARRKQIRSLLRRLLSKPYAQRPTLEPSIAADLRRRYRPDILRLQELLDQDLSLWLD